MGTLGRWLQWSFTSVQESFYKDTQNEPHDGQRSLRSSYNSHVRPLMDTIDHIRSLGLECDQHMLPKIAVIGDQSVGKSSCLEALSGIQLPRGNGIVTRVPLEMKMRTHKEWKCTIGYVTREGLMIKKPVRSPAEVGALVREAQAKITGDNCSMSANLITLDLESPDVPDLTLIDLPGIIRFSDENPDVEKEMSEMITSFIEPENTIILAVFPVGADIETVGALALASKVDPDKKRTMGIITKLDLVDRGSENTVNDTLAKEFGLGIYAVRNRSQEDLNSGVPLQEARKKEEDFFKKHLHFGTMDQSKFGVGRISDKLVKVLSSKIQDALPDITKYVEIQLANAKQERDKLGRGISEVVDERKRELIKNLAEYTEMVLRMSKGEYRDEPMDIRLFTRWREETEDFAEQIQERTNQGVKVLSEDEENILESIKSHRGNELPGFINGYPVAKSNIQTLVSSYSNVATEYARVVSCHVEEILLDLATQKFRRYPKLACKVKQLVDERHQVAREHTDDDIHKLFIQESFVWTQDGTYKKELKTIGEHEAEEEGEDSEEDEPVDDDMSAIVKGVVDGFTAYMKVAERRITDAIPLTVMYHSLHVLPEEIKNYVLAIAAYPAEVVDDLFEEDTDVAVKRKRLDDYLKKLREAEKRLAAL